jgi:3-oxoacyl-[acyl-carrier-protein] synthase-1
MADTSRVVITGSGAVCGAGTHPAAIWDALATGRSAIAPIQAWDAGGWPHPMAAEIVGVEARTLVPDRKLHKLIRRTDMLGLYAGSQAIDASGFAAHRDALEGDAAEKYSDRCGVFVGSGGGAYQTQYDFFPLMTEAGDSLEAFGRELGATVNPMWLLRTLPNNVLCHIGIRYGLKGTNACITNHSASGILAVIEAAAALREGEADRAVAIAHDAPIEPQAVMYYGRVGLLAKEALRPFDAGRDGSLMGEGAAALVLETEASARERGVPVLGEVLGGAEASEGLGLLAIREDGGALARAIELALARAGFGTTDIGMIVAHGNGTAQSDASEGEAIRSVFGGAAPPVTSFKWSYGHLLAASGMIDAVMALEALRRRSVPGIATLRELDPALEGLPVSSAAQAPRGDVALVLCRGFAGTNSALLLRAAPAEG